MSNVTRLRILAIGEVLWDIIRGEEHIGGAPFNLAAHLVRLGCEASVFTRVGTDPRGQAALKEMKRLGVGTELVQIDSRHPTGWAVVELTGDGVPTFGFPGDPAYNFIEADDRMLSHLADARFDAICFGTLQQKGELTRRSLMKVLRSAPATHVLYDVNIRMDFYPQDIIRQSLAFSTVVKLNADEAPLVAMRLYGVILPEAELAQRLFADFPLRVVCVTKGADGCTVYGGGTARNCACEPVKVADTVGAGDAFSAAFLEHYCRTGDFFASAQRGNLLGAYVASQPGAVPEYDDFIRKSLITQDSRPKKGKETLRQTGSI
jgi:fructokinase